MKEVGKLNNNTIMINSIKKSAILCVSTFLLLISCSENDDKPTITTTYKLTMKATIPTSGTTNFSTISYKKADGTTVTLSNTSTSFLESFDISSGHNIFLTVSGTNNGATQPTLNISYAVEKFENNVSKGITCFGSSVSVGGTAGSWQFSASSNTTFNGSSCQ